MKVQPKRDRLGGMVERVIISRVQDRINNEQKFWFTTELVNSLAVDGSIDTSTSKMLFAILDELQTDELPLLEAPPNQPTLLGLLETIAMNLNEAELSQDLPKHHLIELYAAACKLEDLSQYVLLHAERFDSPLSENIQTLKLKLTNIRPELPADISSKIRINDLYEKLPAQKKPGLQEQSSVMTEFMILGELKRLAQDLNSSDSRTLVSIINQLQTEITMSNDKRARENPTQVLMGEFSTKLVLMEILTFSYLNAPSEQDLEELPAPTLGAKLQAALDNHPELTAREIAKTALYLLNQHENQQLSLRNILFQAVSLRESMNSKAVAERLKSESSKRRSMFRLIGGAVIRVLTGTPASKRSVTA